MTNHRMLTVAVLLALSYVFSLDALASAPLTFEERVKAQEAIERVYYNHRIWPKENPKPKPPFEETAARAAIEAKVTDYLKKCMALDEYWQRPIRPEQLQAEMDRMAKGTKDPGTLQILFDALGNDPHLIAECLARPVLADRLFRNWFDSDSRIHAEARNQARRAVEQATATAFGEVSSGGCWRVTYRLVSRGANLSEETGLEDSGCVHLDPEEFQSLRESIPEVGTLGIVETEEGIHLTLPLAISESTITLEMMGLPKESTETWLGRHHGFADPRTLSVLGIGDFLFRVPSPSATCDGEWMDGVLAWPGVPSGRVSHTAVWTGAEMIIWGGTSGVPLRSGARYNPSTDTWTPMSTGENCPEGRESHTAVWTGVEMIVWGGIGEAPLSSGARYDPSNDAWLPTPTGVDCPSARKAHTAVWTGTDMIVWGGEDVVPQNTGGRYRPSSDSWTPTSTEGACPSARSQHTAVWTGQEMIIWGGPSDNTGGRYSPAVDSWQATSTEGDCPVRRIQHTAVWTGSEMIVWGGRDGDPFCSGGRYVPSTDTWVATSGEGACPYPRWAHTAVWTGSEMIVWGGMGGNLYAALNDGGRYSPGTDTWTVTPAGDNCPLARFGQSAVWTGTEMIVWGGDFSNNNMYTDTGGRYDPSGGSWVATSTGTGAPTAREGNTTTWTGTEMVIWGGGTGSYHDVNTGGRYIPSTDTWVTTSTGAPCPSPRSGHVAVWTGTEVVVWGGYTYETSMVNFNTGGRYNPTMDTWTPMAVGEQCPTGRFWHTAVWTGAEMVIWGGAFRSSGYRFLNSGGRYDPSADTWRATSTGENCPSGRFWHTAVWTGAEVIIWGGYYYHYYDFYYLKDGGRYYPATDSWTATSTGENCPIGRAGHTAVWTGTEMLVWGGGYHYGSVGYTLDSGGRYDPGTDHWSSTPLGGACPTPRSGHTAVWTGTEMVVWGGASDQTGGRYRPSVDSWEGLAMGRYCPSSRAGHQAVWTGAAMLVWGGNPRTRDGGVWKPCESACAITCTATASMTSGVVPLAVDFTSAALVTDCTGTPTFAWTFGDGTTSAEQNPSHTYLAPGPFTWALAVTVEGVTCGKTGTVTVGPGLPGDGNGDGVVSIGEVQQAINMFLGTQAPGNGVDCNGDGIVSIGEVQKVINAFLGLPISC